MKPNQIALSITLVALGILSMVPMIRAAESSGADASKDALNEPFPPNVTVSIRLPLQDGKNLSYGVVTGSSTEEGEESASELNRKLTNPVSDIWSISNQFNNFELNNGQWNNNWNFQPVRKRKRSLRDTRELRAASLMTNYEYQ